jgi:PAS domain S-box-containing protein
MKLQELTVSQDELEFLYSALEATEYGVSIIDIMQSHVPVVYANKAFELLTGYKKSEILERDSQFLIGDDLDQEGIDEVKRAMEEGRSCTVMIRLYKKTGELFWNELNLSPIRDHDGNITHYIGVQNDVTEREVMRQNLNDQRIELEKAMEKLKYQTEQKKKLLSLVAHDLRAPLANIQSLNDLAVQSKDADEANLYVQMSSNLAADTCELVSDLLHWRSIERGDFEVRKSPIHLSIFADSIEKYLLHFGARKDIHVVLHRNFGARIYPMDVKRMQQVISNLVSNAIKYSKRGSKIEVLMSSSETEFVMQVRDYGRGIQPHELSNIFEAFEKTSTVPTEGESSFGLGLAIVQRIVEKHDGKIEVESTFGEGTCFTVRV